jgi:hypothetical protein
VIERGVVDGVTALRSKGVPGRHLAALTFRVGRFDETLPTAGITHMVEHLTLSEHQEAGYQFNASVSGRHTTFYLETRNPADITTFMAAVCGGLSADHSALLDRERRILRTEAASRGSAGALGTCLAERYGARGPGWPTTGSLPSSGPAGMRWLTGPRRLTRRGRCRRRRCAMPPSPIDYFPPDLTPTVEPTNAHRTCVSRSSRVRAGRPPYRPRPALQSAHHRPARNRLHRADSPGGRLIQMLRAKRSATRMRPLTSFGCR